MDTATKATTHTVTASPDGFVVVSGTSGRSYLVVPLTTGGAACNCEHARKVSRIAVRCSHVQAVEAFAANWFPGTEGTHFAGKPLADVPKRKPCEMCDGAGEMRVFGYCSHGLRRGYDQPCTDACSRLERCAFCGGSGVVK